MNLTIESITNQLELLTQADIERIAPQLRWAESEDKKRQRALRKAFDSCSSEELWSLDDSHNLSAKWANCARGRIGIRNLYRNICLAVVAQPHITKHTYGLIVAPWIELVSQKEG